MNYLQHLFDYAEVYTVALVWVTVPLAFYLSYLRLPVVRVANRQRGRTDAKN